MAVLEVHCNLRVDPSGAGVCGVAAPVYSEEAVTYRTELFMQRGLERRVKLTGVHGATG